MLLKPFFQRLLTWEKGVWYTLTPLFRVHESSYCSLEHAAAVGEAAAEPSWLRRRMQERNHVYETIAQTIRALLTERNDPAPELHPETPIAASGLDSLDVAVLVVRLEEILGVDPFRDAGLTRYPRTLGEMAALYAQHNEPV